ncbi:MULTISPECIES: hypothetical protein [unclassified Sphingomonas]|uniref:hypothetical protein n=1 Tax=unclassified Sphingomonas TaxID=196159 RepID=UPI001F59AD18|nr:MULTISPECIES: hypothetical protein [unclassified Sphingomonas]
MATTGKSNEASNPWPAIGMEAWALSMEASAVIGLRVFQRMMAGPGGNAESDAEAHRMIDEKMAAAWQLQVAMMTGGLGTTPAVATKKIIRHYSGKVRANRKRLGG